MTIELKIDRLVIDSAAGQRLDQAALKLAVERELAGLISAYGACGIRSAPVKTLVAPAAPAAGARGEAEVARGVATRIYEAMKR